MKNKRPKLNVEMNPTQYYPFIREDIKKKLEGQFPNDPKAVKEHLGFADNLHILEKEMDKVMAAIDQRMRAAEDKALTFLEASPERIPSHIKRLVTVYEQWQKENQ